MTICARARSLELDGVLLSACLDVDNVWSFGAGYDLDKHAWTDLPNTTLDLIHFAKYGCSMSVRCRRPIRLVNVVLRTGLSSNVCKAVCTY